MEKIQSANPREIALKTLYKIEIKGAYVNLALKDAFNKVSLMANDKALLTNLVYGCIKYKLHLDYVISQFSSVKLKKLSDYVRIILWLGIYQLVFMDKIPASAAVNECVKLAKRYAPRSAGLINAVLRRASVDYSKISWPKDDISYLSAYYSYPKELVELYIELFGAEQCRDLLIWGNNPSKITASVNTLKTTADKLIEILSDEGVSARRSVLDNCIIIDATEIPGLKSYKDGLFTIQGETSYLAATVLAPKSGEFVMDLCAAPGGKSLALAQIMENKGRVLAFDIHAHKIELIEQNAARMGLGIIDSVCHDSSKLLEGYKNTADRVLLDAPCSGLGIISKKSDIRYSYSKKKVDELVKIQYRLLCTASEYLKAGGRLVYSTCTINKAENEEIIEKFLESHPDFCTVDITEYLKPFNKSAKSGYTTFYPHIDNTDGFFIAALTKKQTIKTGKVEQ